MSQLLDDLRAARALIEDPKRWTRGANARDDRGDACDSLAQDAACWCASGALDRVAGDTNPWDARRRAMSTALTAVDPNGFGIVEINDRDGHAAVLALFDKAIAAEEDRQ